MEIVPLHLHALPEPPGRCAVIRALDFDAAIEMDGAVAEAVVAKRFDGERTERRAKEAILRRSLKANVEKEPGEGSLALLRFWRSLPRSVRGTLGVLTAGLMIFLVPKLIIEYGPWTPHSSF